MTELDRAIETLKKEYEKAQKLEFVKNPIAYALYHTWRFYDRRSKKND